MPVEKRQFLDNSGNPLNGGLVYFYAAGTSTPQNTYSDSTLATPNSNPVVLDSAGRATIYFSAASYKVTVRTSAGVLIYTQDNVTATNVSSTAIGEFYYFGGDSTSPITLTAYPSGATADKTHAGTAIYSVDSADIPAGTYVLEGMLLATTGTVTIALVNLSDGSPDTAMVTVSSANTVGARVVSSAITFAASGTSKFYAVKGLVTTGAGFAWALRLRRTA